jgi:hypothetical protein
MADLAKDPKVLVEALLKNDKFTNGLVADLAKDPKVLVEALLKNDKFTNGLMADLAKDPKVLVEALLKSDKLIEGIKESIAKDERIRKALLASLDDWRRKTDEALDRLSKANEDARSDIAKLRSRFEGALYELLPDEVKKGLEWVKETKANWQDLKSWVDDYRKLFPDIKGLKQRWDEQVATYEKLKEAYEKVQKAEKVLNDIASGKYDHAFQRMLGEDPDAGHEEARLKAIEDSLKPAQFARLVHGAMTSDPNVKEADRTAARAVCKEYVEKELKLPSVDNFKSLDGRLQTLDSRVKKTEDDLKKLGKK